jgi:hypothetical protein
MYRREHKIRVLTSIALDHHDPERYVFGNERHPGRKRGFGENLPPVPLSLKREGGPVGLICYVTFKKDRGYRNSV